jgi:hypothetical protein
MIFWLAWTAVVDGRLGGKVRIAPIKAQTRTV